MAKIHKKGCSLRPVLSAINTAEYAVCKWLEAQIKPLYRNKWSVNSTQSFVEDLNSIRPSQTDVCVSFDIKSLYTSVPLKEVIDDVTDALYDDEAESVFTSKLNTKKSSPQQLNMKKEVFKTFLSKCSKSIFLYNENVYQQIDGLSMGSPLAPILANWFVAMVEKTILEDPKIPQPKFYRRYVDDIFAVFSCESDKETFFNHLNKAHGNLKFTMENMDTSKKSLPFLDVDIKITSSNKFETKVYQKPTNTGVVLNYVATVPKNWKSSVVKCLLHRAQRVTSSRELLRKDIHCLKTMFLNNGYPEAFLDKIITDFLNNTEQRDGSDSSTCQNTTETSTDPLKSVYLTLPYIGKPSEKLHKRLRTEMLQHKIDLKAAYRSTKVGSYFSLKQDVPTLLRSDVVYKFECPLDKDSRYIGETQRHFFTRISDHCSTTSAKQSQQSAVRDHILNCNDCSRSKNIVDCFSILRTCSGHDILSQEALCIGKMKPSINIQLAQFNGTRVPINIY